MKIELKKIGTTLSSRPAGKEAYAAMAPSLQNVNDTETVEVDFNGILSLSPGWADEFLTPLLSRFGDRLVLLPSDNLSVIATLDLLEDISGKKFK
ncbi:MAG: DUF4325 domain-containing protein, partial [Parcubacteria group bacterium]|nr:DUF4325 domain-containing protein [Parcubacteria group bacterium]